MLQNLNLLKSKTQGGHPLTTWTWCGKKMFDMERHIYIKFECAYIPHAQVSKNLNNERSHEDSLMEWNIYKWVPL